MTSQHSEWGFNLHNLCTRLTCSAICKTCHTHTQLKWHTRNSHGLCFLLLQDSTSGTPVTMRVDPKGFYLCWVDQNNEIDLLDIATIRDVRTGQFAKKPRVSTNVQTAVSVGGAAGCHLSRWLSRVCVMCVAIKCHPDAHERPAFVIRYAALGTLVGARAKC